MDAPSARAASLASSAALPVQARPTRVRTVTYLTCTLIPTHATRVPSRRPGVRLIGAHVGGSLSFSGANLSNPEGLALQGLELTVDGYMHCHEGFTARGQVMLLGARIGGMLLFNGARLFNPDGLALEAARVSVDDGLFCGEGSPQMGR
jgi:hypothetical protein